MKKKEALRKKRCSINYSENVETIFSNLIPLINWESKPIIAGYWPIVGEIDDVPLLEHCHTQGLSCCLPFITSKSSPLIFKAWQPGDILENGMYKIPAPLPKAPILIPNVLLIPLVAFDKNCHRLGKGGGFYDRTLENLRQKHPVFAIGLAYDSQEVGHIAPEAHDQPLDCIVTPSRVITR